MAVDLTPDFDHTFRMGARCSLCHSIRPDEDDKVVKGPDVDYEGAIGICGNCVREMAAAFGWRSDIQVDELEQEVSSLQGHIASLSLEIVELKERVRTLTLHNAELITEVDALFEDDDEAWEEAE